jgi:hypothetical protein
MSARLFGLALLACLALMGPLGSLEAQPPSSGSDARALHQTLVRGQQSVSSGLAGQDRGTGLGPVINSFGVRTNVFAPDGGSVLLGGVTHASETRREAGVPVLGKVPVAGRPLNHGSFGRATQGTQVRAHVRIIDLKEEELRQTGYSPRR